MPSPIAMPFGVCEGTLELAASSPEALIGATRPSDPLTTAAEAVAEAVERARADDTTAAASSTAARATKVRTGTRRVCQTVPSARPSSGTVRRSVAEAAIIAEGLEKSYGKVRALRGVDLR